MIGGQRAPEGTRQVVMVWHGGVKSLDILRRVGLRKHEPIDLKHDF